MTASPRLVAFDLDDTLAPSKAVLSSRTADLLIALAERVEVAIISGAQFGQFQTQVLAQLPPASPAVLGRVHIMPTCGTQYYRFGVDGFAARYAHELTADEKARAMAVAEDQARRLGLWESETWGDILEDRGSQITFSALGQAAPLDAKQAWDPTGEKKNTLRAAIAARLPDLEVRSGGSTSVDITHIGIDKAHGMRQLAVETGIPLEDMLFIGDRLDPDGNDYPVLALGVPCHAVTGPDDTAAFLEGLIPTLPRR
ncbi:MAG: HAD-IIB family hydrolase [Microbacterium sp.]|uniref:HAD-IIB family hydrolase n=1 Tax=Microbacterium sp. TaxID=51671 RepID=UPI0039E495F3